MDLRHLTTFKTIVDEGSFNQAAEKLQYSPSTISMQIQQLENELGIELFDRHKKKVQLTGVGQSFYEHCVSILTRFNNLHEMIAEQVGGKVGHLKIGVSEPLINSVFPDVLMQYCEIYPKVRLTIECWGSRLIAEKVLAEELDLGIGTPPRSNLTLSFDPLLIERMVVLTPAYHPLAQKDKIHLGELCNYRLLLTQQSCTYREVFERVMAERGQPLYSGLDISNMEALKKLVYRGLGIAILPALGASGIGEGLVVREIEEPDLRIPVGIIRKADQVRESSLVESFISLLKREIYKSRETDRSEVVTA